MQDPVDEIKNKLDVKDVISDYIKIEKSGVNFKARCPFHQEKTPSFFVSPSRQIWRCFGCAEGGDMFTFVEKIDGVDFREALQRLGQKAGVEVRTQNPKIKSERNKSLEICDLASKYFHHQLESKNGKLVVEYFKSRGIKKDTIEEFRLGYAPVRSQSLIKFLRERGYDYYDMERAGIAFKSDLSGDWLTRFRSRIIFPIFNTTGNVVGFGARKFTDELAKQMGRAIKQDSAKYINSPQTNIYNKSSILYGLDKAKMAIRQNDVCVIVEGYTDVILAHQAGYKNVIASSGTALAESQLNLIGRFTKNLLTSFDMDMAGDSATRRGIDLAQSLDFDIKVIILDDGMDPADIIVQDIKKWEDAIKNAKSITQFYFDSAFKKFDATTAAGKREIGNILAPIIKNIPSKIEQAHWVQILAGKLAVEQDNVWEEVKKSHNTQHKTYNKNQELNKSREKKLSKKELLAQQILLGVFKNKKLFAAAKKEQNNFDNNLRPLRILNIVLEQSSPNLNKLDAEDKKFVDQLIFEAEMMEDELSGDQFVAILVAYKKVILKEELKKLELNIKKEEQGGNNNTDKLLKKFHKKIQEMNSI